MWSEVDSSMTLQALLGPRDRDNRFLSRFLKKNRLSTRPSSGGGRDALTLSRSSSLSLWVARPGGLLLLCLPPVDGGQDGRGSLPTPSSTAPLFGGCCGCGAGAGVECRGPAPRRRAGWALQPADWWRQQLPGEAGSVRSPQSAPVQPGTAGPVTGCVAEEASLGYRNLEEPTCRRPYGNQTQPEVAAPGPQVWTIARPRDRAITFVTRGARSGAVWSSSQNFRIVTTPVHVPQCF